MFDRTWKILTAPTIAFVAGVVGLAVPQKTPADESHFDKIVLTREFFSEGANFGDFNRDGQMDVVAGPFWYAGPDFKSRYEYQTAEPKDPKGYSANFLAYAHDMNGDECEDIIIIGFPGEETWWFENPKGDVAQAGHWKRHLGLDVTDNESPAFADVTGDGKPELLCHTRGRVGYAEPDWNNPTEPWKFHPVSGEGGWQRYTHGFGFGDVDGDGKRDFLMREGWWKQADDSASAWPFHAAPFGEGGAQMFVYDIDGDGDNDVLTSLQAHGYGIAWFEQKLDGDGKRVFEQHLLVGSTEEQNPHRVKFSQPHAIDVADMNGDGLLDFVTGKRYWAHGPTGDAEPDAPAVLYWFELIRTDEGAEFIPHLIDDDSGVGTQVIARDINGDGLAEVVVGNKKGAFVFMHRK